MFNTAPKRGIAQRKLTLLALLLAVPAADAHAGPEFCVSCTGPEAQYRCALPEGSGNSLPPGFQLHCISTLAREGGHQSCSISRVSQTPCNGPLKIVDLPAGPAPAALEATTGTPSAPQQAESPAGATPAEIAAQPAPSPVEPPSDDVEAKALAQPRVDVPAPIPTTKPVWDEKSGAPKTAAPSAQNASEPPAPDAPASGATGEPAVPEPLEAAGKAVGDAAKSTGSALEKAGNAVGNAAKKSWKCLTSLFGDC